MRKFKDSYDIVYCDIDNTLIYGNYVRFMDWVWNIIHSIPVAKFLAYIQQKFKLYKVNYKLLYELEGSNLIFLTARSYTRATGKMLHDIVKFPHTSIMLGCADPVSEKIKEMITEQGMSNEPLKMCIIDDNEKIRSYAEYCGIDAYNPELLLEEFVI